MKTIYKYQLPIDDDITVEMPVGAQLLTVQMQHHQPCLWAKVDTAAPVAKRKFRWLGTGHPAEGVGIYVGTVQVSNGALVFHLFDQGDSK